MLLFKSATIREIRIWFVGYSIQRRLLLNAITNPSFVATSLKFESIGAQTSEQPTSPAVKASLELLSGISQREDPFILRRFSFSSLFLTGYFVTLVFYFDHKYKEEHVPLLPLA